MDQPKATSGNGMEPSKGTTKNGSRKTSIAKANKRSKGSDRRDDEEVLLNLPAGMKYKLPGKRQRIVVASLVLGLNLILVLAVLLYFYSPSFHDFIYNVGR